MITNLFNPSDKRQYTKRWPMVSGKRIFKVMDERSSDGSEELLSVSHITGITPRSQKNVTMFKSESLVGYKKCAVGDIAANTMWTWQGAIGVSKYEGIVSPAYNVYRQRENFYNSRYLDLLLREKELIDVYHSISTGLRPSRLRLYPEAFMSIAMPVPPIAEQDQIVRFLDWKISSINKLINHYKHETEALIELKSKIIDSAVIAGLDVAESSHNDDVRWNISYPSHWEIKRMREFFSFRKGLSITKANLEQNGIPVISYGQIHSKENYGVGLCKDLFRFVNSTFLDANPNALVENGDFIFADTSEDLLGCGNCVYVDSDDTIFAGYHTVIAHPKFNGNKKYLAYLFQAPTWRYQIRKQVNAVKVYSITQKILKDIYILIPPIEEQNRIVFYLDQHCKIIDDFIYKTKAKIEQLHDLRDTLISNVVTGKIDVRNIIVPNYKYNEEELETSDDAIDEEEITEEE